MRISLSFRVALFLLAISTQAIDAAHSFAQAPNLPPPILNADAEFADRPTSSRMMIRRANMVQESRAQTADRAAEDREFLNRGEPQPPSLWARPQAELIPAPAPVQSQPIRDIETRAPAVDAGRASSSDDANGGVAPHLLVRPPLTVDAQGRVVDARYAGTHHTPATIPDATAQPMWRQPYAYGYFGARPNRHLSQHFGYLRQYNQWSAR